MARRGAAASFGAVQGPPGDHRFGRSPTGLYIVPRGADTEGWVLVGYPAEFSYRADGGDGMAVAANGEGIGSIGDEPTGGVKELSDGGSFHGKIAGSPRAHGIAAGARVLAGPGRA